MICSHGRNVNACVMRDIVGRNMRMCVIIIIFVIIAIIIIIVVTTIFVNIVIISIVNATVTH